MCEAGCLGQRKTLPHTTEGRSRFLGQTSSPSVPESWTTFTFLLGSFATISAMALARRWTKQTILIFPSARLFPFADFALAKLRLAEFAFHRSTRFRSMRFVRGVMGWSCSVNRSASVAEIKRRRPTRIDLISLNATNLAIVRSERPVTEEKVWRLRSNFFVNKGNPE